MQEGVKDCGVACLLTIIKTYGGNVSGEYLRVLTNTTKDGTNAYYLCNAAKTLGFDTRALKGKVTDLDKKYLPCIAHVIIDSKYKHFVVIHAVTSKYVTIADPAWGIRKMSVEKFNDISTNQFLIFIPNKPIPYIDNDKRFINLILNNIFKYKNALIIIFIFSLIYTLINILTSYGFQFIIEDAVEMNSVGNLKFIIVFMFIFIFLKHIINFLRIELFNYINHKLDFILMSDIFKHILSLPYQYYKNRSTGDILTRINDLSSIRETLSNLFIYIFVDGILVILVFINLVRINLSLGIISLGIVVVYFLIIKLFSILLRYNILENKKSISSVNNFLIESIESVTSVKALNVENEKTIMMEDNYQKYLNKSYRLNQILNFQNLLKNMVDGGGLILILFIGSLLVLKDKMTIGELITYNTLIVYFLEPIKNIMDFDLEIKNMKVAYRRIVDLYSIKGERLTIDNKYVSESLLGNIDIDGLSYSYNGRDKVLENITLKIEAGDRVLICGESGSGKSTLAKILMKFYSVDNEVVRVDEKDINDHNILKIRRDICYVSQNEMLLTDTIYNNIVLNRLVDYNEFLNICKKIQVDKIANHNILKYDMLLEENGFNLSEGERQKIVIARSLIKKSNIYIFDESFSQIDIENEKIILNNIFKLLKGKTVIVISHRFDNNSLFNKVFNMKEGTIY